MLMNSPTIHRVPLYTEKGIFRVVDVGIHATDAAPQSARDAPKKTNQCGQNSFRVVEPLVLLIEAGGAVKQTTRPQYGKEQI